MKNKKLTYLCNIGCGGVKEQKNSTMFNKRDLLHTST